MEGQTSLVDDMAALVRAAQKHKAVKPDPHEAESGGLVFSVLEQLIADAPPGGEHEDHPVTPATPERTFHPIFVNKGWPERYCGDMDEAEGGDWKAAFAVAAPIVERGGILLLHGTRGTGKTRMSAEIARTGRFPMDQTKGKKAEEIVNARRTAVYRTAMRFFLEVRATFRKGSEASELDVIDSLTEPGLLVLDELQERGETAFEDRLLTHLIDSRYNAMRPTIIIANLTKTELEATLGPSITDRVAENGRRVEFTWGSYRRTPR